jgi:hypothetical protein
VCRYEDIHEVELQHANPMQGTAVVASVVGGPGSGPVKSLRRQRDTSRFCCRNVSSATWHFACAPQKVRMAIV